jgi:hypothetical protein
MIDLSPMLCKTALSALNWTQKDLVERSGVNKRTIADFEREAHCSSKRGTLFTAAFPSGLRRNATPCCNRTRRPAIIVPSSRAKTGS